MFYKLPKISLAITITWLFALYISWSLALLRIGRVPDLCDPGLTGLSEANLWTAAIANYIGAIGVLIVIANILFLLGLAYVAKYKDKKAEARYVMVVAAFEFAIMIVGCATIYLLSLSRLGNPFLRVIILALFDIILLAMMWVNFNKRSMAVRVSNP